MSLASWVATDVATSATATADDWSRLFLLCEGAVFHGCPFFSEERNIIQRGGFEQVLFNQISLIFSPSSGIFRIRCYEQRKTIQL